MKKGIIITVFVMAAASFLAAAVFGRSALGYLKSEGYVRYTTDEAVEIAHKKCAQCHKIDKTAKYCMRCGPPFIVVVHNMRRLVEQLKEKQPELQEIRNGDAVAITQVWNALVGNWEDTWRREDLQKLLENDTTLLKLLDTPVKKREIEVALEGKHAGGSDLTITEPVE